MSNVSSPLTSKLSTPSDVLKFWFGEEYISNKPALSTLPYIKSKLYSWYSGNDTGFIKTQHDNKDLIDEIANNYPILPIEGDIDSNIDNSNWSSLEALVAKVILFDQFPREVYRGTSKAFEYDRYSQQILSYLVDNNIIFSDKLSYSEKFFLLHGYLHSENREHHLIIKEIMDKIVLNESSDIVDHHNNTVKPFYKDHGDIVLRFDRYPSRNDALNRISTQEEEEWLNSPDVPQWAKSQFKK